MCKAARHVLKGKVQQIVIFSYTASLYVDYVGIKVAMTHNDKKNASHPYYGHCGKPHINNKIFGENLLRILTLITKVKSSDF